MQAAHHILGPWGVDSDLRRWGMKLAEHGGKRGKKRAIIAIARKLAVLLHRLWVSGDVYVPLRRMSQAAVPAVILSLVESSKKDLIQAVSLRHDCVHRNGVDKDGNTLTVFTKQFVQNQSDLIKDFSKR